MKYLASLILLLTLCAPSLAQTTTPEGERDLAKDAVDRLYSIGQSAIERMKQAQEAEKVATAKATDFELANAKLTADLATAQKTIDEQYRLLHPFTVRVGGDIAAALKAAKPGDVVTIEPGTYAKVTATVPTGVTLDGAGKVTLDGGQTVQTALSVSGIAKGVTATNYSSEFESNRAAVVLLAGGTVDACHVDANAGTGIGIPAGSHGAKLTNSTANRNGLNGITGTASDDVQIVNVEQRANNQGHAKFAAIAKADPTHWVLDGDKGALKPSYHLNKFTQMNRLLVDGLTSLDNRGPALWLDADNRNSVIRNSTLGAGVTFGLVPPISLEIELSTGLNGATTLVENVTFVKGDGPALTIGESRNVTVKGCSFPGYAEVRAQDGTKGGRPVRSRFTNNQVVFVLPGNITFTGNTFDGQQRPNELSANGAIRPSGPSMDDAKVRSQLNFSASANVAK
jgi:hypothetical protein